MLLFLFGSPMKPKSSKPGSSRFQIPPQISAHQESCASIPDMNSKTELDSESKTDLESVELEMQEKEREIRYTCQS